MAAPRYRHSETRYHTLVVLWPGRYPGRLARGPAPAWR